MTATVCLSNVCKSYDEGESQRRVLWNLDFQAELGEAVALLGASGSGKSTLLNVMSGLTVPDSGTVVIDNTALESLDEQARTLFRRRAIGFIFQSFHLIATLTVEENLRLPLQLNGLDTPQDLERLYDMLDRVGLRARTGQLPDRLSGGEQQRVAVCRALMHRPRLLLADEPTGNLDGHTAEQVLDLLFDLSRAHNSTLIVVTHSRQVAARCDRIQRLSDGALHTEPVRSELSP